MTIEEYAAENKDKVNFMVSMLNNFPSVVDERHLEIAKEVLRKKVLVGLQTNMEESARRFFSHVKWKKDDDDWNPCEKRILFKGGVNSNKHSKVEEDWKLLASKNSLNIQLYEYAVELFHEQGQHLFGSDTDVGKKLHKPFVHSKAAVISRPVEETLCGVMELDIERQLKNGEYPTSKSPSQSQSDVPSTTPSDDLSSKPSAVPSLKPSLDPSGVPSAGPSSGQSLKPSQPPSDVPISAPSLDPSSKPSAVSSLKPSFAPSGVPSAGPSSGQSLTPSQSPSDAPISAPVDDPSNKPSAVPFETKFCSKWCS